jgi:hypothetical protein
MAGFQVSTEGLEVGLVTPEKVLPLGAFGRIEERPEVHLRDAVVPEASRHWNKPS